MDNYQNLTLKGESSEKQYVNVFVFNEDQCFFYLNYHKIFIIIICFGCVLESPRRPILIHIHNIWFYGEILKINFFYHFITRLPHFYYMLDANRGSLLYGDVSAKG